jgi:hypothetical protein
MRVAGFCGAWIVVVAYHRLESASVLLVAHGSETLAVSRDICYGGTREAQRLVIVYAFAVVVVAPVRGTWSPRCRAAVDSLRNTQTETRVTFEKRAFASISVVGTLHALTVVALSSVGIAHVYRTGIRVCAVVIVHVVTYPLMTEIGGAHVVVVAVHGDVHTSVRDVVKYVYCARVAIFAMSRTLHTVVVVTFSVPRRTEIYGVWIVI